MERPLRFRGVDYLGAAFCIVGLAFFSGCSTVQGEVEAGRRELLLGDPSRAIARFQRAADMDPDRMYFSLLPESSWTYLGRAYYQTGNLAEARRALEKAVTRSNEDHLAKLYLGLVLAREGDRLHGLRYIEEGLQGIHDWLNYIEQRFAFSYGRFWDPNKEIRSKIRSDLSMISSGQIDWPKLLGDAEWVGRQMEEEIDRARRDETAEHFRDGDSRDRR
ncbi:MAG TPA: tetratricopeptide repeat protein [Candidatus Binatia bacterium]|jgi:tetratricopeptide (TPR) repeat protein